MRSVLCLVLIFSLPVMAAGKASFLRIQDAAGPDEAIENPGVHSTYTPWPSPGGLDLAGRLDTVGGTTYDWQTNGPAVSRIVYDPSYGIHVAWTFSAEAGPGYTDRNMRYNFCNTSGAWQYSTGPGFINWGVNVLPVRSGFGNLDVNPTTHNAYIGAYKADTIVTVLRQTTPGGSSFEEASGPVRNLWPLIGLTSTGKVHVALTLDGGINNRTKLYYSRVDPWGTWSTPAALYGSAPFPGYPNHGLAAGKHSQKVAAVWGVNIPPRELAYYVTSANDGVNWTAAAQLPFPATFHPGSETIPSFNISSLYPFYDSRDTLHIVASVNPVIVRSGDSAAYALPAEIWHWSVATGWSLVARSACDTTRMAGRVGFNAILATRPTIGEGAANEFVCVWEEFDSSNVELSTGMLRADIYGARSTNGGASWGDKVRVTDPDQTSKRFPCVADKMQGDTVLVCYMVDLVAGSAVQGQGSSTSNPVVVQRIPKALFRMPGADVGVTRIISPTGTITSGTTVTPACSIYNSGTTTASYTVRMKIGAFYNNTASVAGHAPGSYQYLTFPNWVASQLGTHAVSCSTELTGDINPANDRATGTCDVQQTPQPDVGCTKIVAPAGIVYSGTVIAPVCSVYNAGTTTASYSVRMKIGSSYNNTATVSSHAPGTYQRVTFANWTANPLGTLAVSCSTELTGDVNTANDKVTGSVQVQILPADVGCTRIVAPSGNIAYGAVVTPACSVYNSGSVTVTYPVHMKIGATYDNTVTVTAHAPGTSQGVVFPDWTATPAGAYSVTAFTDLTGDTNRGNDTARGACNVLPAVTPGWAQMSDVPPGPKGKGVKDGGCLAYQPQASSFKLQAGRPPTPGPRSPIPDPSYIYALKGNNRYEFYRYNSDDNTWTAKESIPALGSTGKKKAVKKGASMTEAEGRLYATKGNGTVEFWQYQLTAQAAGSRPRLGGKPEPAAWSLGLGYPWIEVAPVPIGAKVIKEGSDQVTVAVGDTAYIYLLKGSGTREFYRYNTMTNVWESKADAPLGASGKPYKNGSCLVYDANADVIYVLKGSYNELFAYAVAGNAWGARTSLPLVGRSGKKKKVKDGAGMACVPGMESSRLYVLKGGNTLEFWSYQTDSDKWTEETEMPAGGGKSVKGGGAIVYAPLRDALYATKGNGTLEFYRYQFVADGLWLTANGPNTLSNSSLVTRHSSLVIAPNPFTRATTITYTLPGPAVCRLSLYDLTGRLVATLADGYHNAGSYTTNLKSKIQNPKSKIAPGVYLLRLDSPGYRATRKLVIE